MICARDQWLQLLTSFKVTLVPLLACGVPDLGLDAPVVDDEGAGLELDPDGGLGVEAELVAGEAGQDLRLAHRRVADQHHLEDVVHLLPGPRHALARCRSGSASAPGVGKGEEAAALVERVVCFGL
jgi:hypothetical protein